MDYNSLNFSNLKKVTPYSSEVRRAVVYKDSTKHYKVWDYHLKIGPYFILDKLDLLNQGYDNLIGKKLNLINKKTCPAFDDLIYHNDYCCGYSIFSGTKLSNIEQTSKNYLKYYDKYIKFIDILVETSLENNCFIPDIGLHNVILTNNSFSIIDLDFVPVSISGYKKLSPKDREHIDKYILTGNYFVLSGLNPVFPTNDSIYLNSIKKKIF